MQGGGHLDGAVCDGAAGAPPVPDNGTPGTAATPDGQVRAEPKQPTDPPTEDGADVSTYNYFNNTTINNSSSGVSTGTASAGIDSDGDGFSDEGEGEGEGGSASGGENCQTAPVCDGDAVACAIVKQTWSTRCNLEDGPDAAALKAAWGNLGSCDEEDKDQYGNCPSFGMPTEEIDFEDVQFSETAIFTASCLPDRQISVMGTSVVLPMGMVCTLADALGVLVVISGFLVAYQIVMGGFKKQQAAMT